MTNFGFIVPVCLSVRVEHLVSDGKDFREILYMEIFYEVVHTFRRFVKINKIGKNGVRKTLPEDLRTFQHLTGNSLHNREKVFS